MTTDEARPLPPDPAGRPDRVLVVEDERCMLELNLKMLVEAGYEADAALDGAAAWDLLQLNSYDLLITDHVMPKVTGLELIEMVQAAGLALPVIMATGELPKEALARAPWLQPAATLIKPYTLADFLGAVENVLSGAARSVLLQSDK